MNDLVYLTRQYSMSNVSRLNQLCEPLQLILNIPYFFYYSLDEEGQCTILGNDTDYLEFYYANQMHLKHPLYVHPSFLRSGYALIPAAWSKEDKETAHLQYGMQDLFLILEARKDKVEGFVFYDRHLNKDGLLPYVENLHLLMKFIPHFKKEAAFLIEKMKAEQFNMREEQKENFFIVDPTIPFVKKNPKVDFFLKAVLQLSPQEECCLELFKKGYSAQATASIMNLSRRTVESYFESIKNKLGCQSKSELLNY